MLPTQLSFGNFLEAKLEFLEIIQVSFVPQISAWFVNYLISLIYFKHIYSEMGRGWLKNVNIFHP